MQNLNLCDKIPMNGVFCAFIRRINWVLCKSPPNFNGIVMSENFNAIKRKYKIAAIIASALLGACCGVFLCCVLVIIFKLCAIELFWAIYIPIAIALAAACFFPFWALLKPTDKKIAKKLDSRFALNEKAQTMVEFSTSEQPMAVLQREKADQALGEVVKERVDIKQFLKFLFIPVIALAMLFIGIFVPQRKSTNEPVFNVSETQIISLTKLIEDVDGSELGEDIKVPAVATLNSLLDGLKHEQPQSQMRAAVISSVKIIDNLVASANSYRNIYNSLSQHSDLPKLSYALASGVTYYTSSGQVNSMAVVKSRYMTADAQIETALTRWQSAFMQKFEKEVASDVEGEGSEMVLLSVEEAASVLSSYAAALDNRLKVTVYANRTENPDPLFTVFSGLQTGLASVAANTVNVTDKGFNANIVAECDKFVKSAIGPMMEQSYSLMMDEYIRTELARIFRLSLADFGDSQAVVTPESPGNDDPGGETGSGNAGYGKGDLVYGSDDLILNYEYDGSEGVPKQVAYGEVLKHYNGIVEEMTASGACPEDIAAYLTQYFRLLYSGIEKE